MELGTIILAIVSGSAGAALITVVGNLLTNKQKHTYEQGKKDEAAARKEREDIDALKAAMKYLMLDRIRHLGQRYISEGEIDFDDRRLLNEMHQSYHNGLGGNGDLDVLMKEVNHLPLKTCNGRKKGEQK